MYPVFEQQQTVFRDSSENDWEMLNESIWVGGTTIPATPRKMHPVVVSRRFVGGKQLLL